MAAKSTTQGTSVGAGEVKRIILKTFTRANRDNPAVKVPTDAELDIIVESCVQNAQTIEQPQVIHNLEIDVIRYHRGIFKIAYELAFIWLGESYLDDPIAAKIRAVVLDGVDAQTLGIRGTITLGRDIGSVCFWSQERNNHIAYVGIGDANTVAIVIKIFDVFSAVVVVSEQANKYVRGSLDPDVVRFIRIDPVAKTHRETSFSDEIRQLGRAYRNLINEPMPANI